MPLLAISLFSPKHTHDSLFLGNYANINIVDSLQRIPGVGQVIVFGATDYAMRIWVKPDLMAKLGLTVPDLSNAIKQQSSVNPAGQLGAAPALPTQETTLTVRTQGRLQTADEFGRIAVLVCWDQWYPEAARIAALGGASILFYPTAIGWHPAEKAEFGEAQYDAWRTIQRSHAIANGVFVAVVNRVGFETGNIRGKSTPGHRLIVQPFR